MLNLNRTRTEYRVRMYWFKCTGSKNGVMSFSPEGKPFGCSFKISQDASYIGEGQGLIYSNLQLETTADYPFKKNDKIRYLKHDYIVKNVVIDPNSVSGSDYTNKPSSIVKYVEIEG